MSGHTTTGAGGDEAATATVRLGDIVVEVTAPAALVRFIRERFPLDAGDEAAADVVSVLHAGTPDAAGRPLGRRVSRDRDGSVWCLGAPGLPGLVTRVTGGSPLAVEAWQPGSLLRQAYKRVVAGITETHRHEALVFYALLYPALLVAELRGRFPLHGAAVAREGRVVVIAGLPGAGKSTLSAALLGRGWDLVSDNLVLLGGGALWPFPEPLRLDEASLELAGVSDGEGPLGGAAAGGTGGAAPGGGKSTYARSAHPYDPAPGPYEIAALVVAEPAEETELEVLDGIPVEALLDLNRLALELDAYYTYRAWARLALGGTPQEADAIAGALSEAKLARLTVARGDVGGALEAIGGLFEASSARGPRRP